MTNFEFQKDEIARMLKKKQRNETLYLEEMWEDNEVIGNIHNKAVGE